MLNFYQRVAALAIAATPFGTSNSLFPPVPNALISACSRLQLWTLVAHDAACTPRLYGLNQLWLCQRWAVLFFFLSCEAEGAPQRRRDISKVENCNLALVPQYFHIKCWCPTTCKWSITRYGTSFM